MSEYRKVNEKEYLIIKLLGKGKVDIPIWLPMEPDSTC